MNKVYLALGTNIEPRINYLSNALQELEESRDISIRRKSPIYETAPVGYTDQGDFLNMVIEADTALSTIELLDKCQQIEKELGRKRGIRFGPRTIDLDILLYNHENSKMERLIIPHPRMHKRAFVLIPLNDIAPNLIIPATEKRVADLINELPESDKKDVTIWTQKDSADE
ncbi:2-amino-4-hydroxy-6-hydroxymethyldihydropteridine diphosphokinase [Virgibacillus indicus]|uniref:2-amino-4-hydroxy-6-hydroxymethyldihydropteridine diphosphokinase n=1 Tax=Virgibacillus indicus TaxID=2024554 RepID=A0A265NBX2_9BACI|nr:2-amino-4-hydroxy-6-hydroxymethyldihydropteridine diphosphokinase [Virgibacillus indicus]OZU89550.1 2-amino-4-hydroxy-6-hydroxymethyldihydropteridine diphosphokinase [Virgibacillus indicus]